MTIIYVTVNYNFLDLSKTENEKLYNEPEIVKPKVKQCTTAV